VWEEFGFIVATAQPRGTALSGAISEIRYLKYNLLPRDHDSIILWNKYQHVYPPCAKIVKARFNVVATSVPCERIFSKPGAIINERRARLNSRKIQQLIFLNVTSD
jgi:hypothetical protein